MASNGRAADSTVRSRFIFGDATRDLVTDTVARDRGHKRVDVDRYLQLVENLQGDPVEGRATTATTGPVADGDARGVVLWSRVRGVVGAFRPAVWLVLQDAALDAAWRDGRLVAATSARLVAEHLRIDPSTAASALRTLRHRGLVELSHAAGPNGRFGLAAYTLHLPDGVDVLGPCTELSYTENPDAVTDAVIVATRTLCSAARGTVPLCRHRSGNLRTRWNHPRVALNTGPLHPVIQASLAVAAAQPCPARTEVSCLVDPPIELSVSESQRVRRRGSSPAAVEQGAFDLGSGAQ